MSEHFQLKPVALHLWAVWLLSGSTAVLADVDLSGNWSVRLHEDLEERTAGPVLGDYAGLPINTAARLRAESWDDATWSVPEHQCDALAADYAPHGVGSMRVWSEVDLKTQQLIAWHVVYWWHTPHRVIWMDGRRHPPAGAQHTWMGFSTGEWVGDTLVVTTTHLKEGWIRRNGVPRSDLGVLTEYWMRHGNYLTVVSVVEDPVYLTAPFIRGSSWGLDLGYQIEPDMCLPKAESELPRGFVAHHLPGTNAALQESSLNRKLPSEAAAGGEETMYPEYIRRLAGHATSGTHDSASVNVQKAQRTRPTPQGHPGGVDPATIISTDRHDVVVLPVRRDVFVLMSSAGNTTVQIGDDGILIVDTQPAELSPLILEQIRRLSRKPIRNIINTSVDIESTGGNGRIAMEGRSMGVFGEERRAWIYAHENVLRAMSANVNGKSARDSAAWPTDVYFTESRSLYFNGEAVEVVHVPSARTDGDSIVYFRRSDVVSAGGVFLTTGYPSIELARGGSINGVIEALNRIIDIAVPEKDGEGGTLVVPGRGRIGDQHDIVAYRDMITIFRDRVKEMMHRGFTLQQVQAARPTQDYDGRYGTEHGAWTTKRFVEAIYRSLASGGGT